MKGEQPTPNQPDGGRHEQRDVEPKIYAASLSDYNHGRLHGAWIGAAQEAEAIQDDINGMLARSRMPDAEEWAIHDYEGFGAFKLGEYESVGAVALIGTGIAQHGRAFSHWANIVGTQDTERLHRFDEHYRGAWNSLGDYAQDLLDDMGTTVESFTPGWLQPYVNIDYDALGDDMASDLETAHDPDGTVHIFEPEA